MQHVLTVRSSILLFIVTGAFMFLGAATAFTPRNSFTAVTTTAVTTTAAKYSIADAQRLTIVETFVTRSPTFLKFGDEESEWYSPPPSPPITKKVPEVEGVKLPRGVKPKVTVIRSKIELDEFLAEDDRLCLVKFHAAW